VSLVLHQELARGYTVLFEGAQATLLDVDHGTYPFVTSSSAGAGGAAIGLGVPPTRIDAVLGIAKAYTTRVGSGPLPTEIGGALEEEVRARGHEFGASTGRPRRCGWFDALVVRYSMRVNGCESLALTKLDVLDPLAEIPVCVAYRHEGKLLQELPTDIDVFAACEPVYETLPGWKTSTAGIRDYASLPPLARAYVERLGELIRGEIGIVSTGPERHDTLIRSRSVLASWFE
jgi:adenylosuccinate synthase